MIRSISKGPYISYNLLKKINKLNKESKKEIIKTWSRSSIILPIMIVFVFSDMNTFMDMCPLFSFQYY